MRVDEGESVESKDDVKCFVLTRSTVFILWQDHGPDKWTRANPVESKDDGKNIALSSNLFLFYGRITDLTPPMQVDEGESATFHCTVDANPISAKTVREVAIVIRKSNGRMQL